MKSRMVHPGIGVRRPAASRDDDAVERLASGNARRHGGHRSYAKRRGSSNRRWHIAIGPNDAQGLGDGAGLEYGELNGAKQYCRSHLSASRSRCNPDRTGGWTNYAVSSASVCVLPLRGGIEGGGVRLIMMDFPPSAPPLKGEGGETPQYVARPPEMVEVRRW